MEENIGFGTDYKKNLSILLRAGYDVSTANSVAADIRWTKLQEEKKRFSDRVGKELERMGLA